MPEQSNGDPCAAERQGLIQLTTALRVAEAELAAAQAAVDFLTEAVQNAEQALAACEQQNQGGGGTGR